MLHTSTSGFVLSWSHNSAASPNAQDLSVVSRSGFGRKTVVQLKILSGALMTVGVVDSW